MPRPTFKGIDPKDIYIHARGFHLADWILGNADFKNNRSLQGEIANAQMVLSALISELFLKCLTCMETGEVPTGHYLAVLFGRLSPPIQQRIEHIWDTEAVPLRNPMWTAIDRELGGGRTLDRSLRGALQSANRAFERMRYGYEPETKDSQFYIGDMPIILERVILEYRPEWGKLRRRVVELPDFDPQTGQPRDKGK